MLFIAAAAAAAAVLSGCAGAPGSVVNDPLAQRLIQAETKLQQSSGMSVVVDFWADASSSSSCTTFQSTANPARFHIALGIDNSRTDELCEISESDGKISAWYENGLLYLSEFTFDDKGCAVNATSHSVTDELAQQFAATETRQQKIADLVQAATAISGTDRRIELELDVPTLLELRKKATDSSTNSIPGGAEASAVVTLTDAGALDSTLVTATFGGHSLSVKANYEEFSGEPEPLPQAQCVTEGPAYSTLEEIQDEFG